MPRVSRIPGAAIALVVSVALVSTPQAQSVSEKRTLIAEDYYRIRSVGSVSISPDGAWVSYTVSTPVEATNGNATEQWVVRSDGSAPPVRVQHSGENVNGMRWGSDSRLIYNAQSATWAIAPARMGSAPEREYPLPATPAGISPDGRWVVRSQALAAPPQPAPPVLSDFERRHEERFRGDAFDWYPFRQDGSRFPLPERGSRTPSELFLVPATGNAQPRQLTNIGMQVGNIRWVPDGSAIVFTANAGFLDELSYGSTDMFRVTPAGDVTRVTDDGYSYSSIAFSPDGRWMSYTRSVSTDMIIELKMDHGGSQDIYVAPAGGGESINLTAEWDLDPGTPQWSPDSRYIYFVAGVGGANHLFRVAPNGGAVEQVTRGERRLNGITFDREFRKIAYTVGGFDRPSDVWVSDIDGSNERRLTDVNAAFLAEVTLADRPSESIRWKSYDGTVVEGFLTFPPGYDSGGVYPLIIMNHGGPHAASGYGFSFKNTFFAANGYVVFQPNFRGSTGYGDAFKWGTWGAWGKNDGEDVLSGVDYLVENYRIDRNRVGSTGHSYGGIITNWLITRYPDRFRAAIPGAGESNWTSNFALSDISRTKETEFFGPPWDPRAREIMIEQSPYLNCGGVQAATLFIHGAVDYRVPLEGAIQMYTCLKKQRVPAKMIIYEGQAHGISGHWNTMHRMLNELRWWDEWLKPEVRPGARQDESLDPAV